MNIDSCANCLLRGWNQVEDLTTLQRCKRCKVIKYCGRDCQTDHWLNVHHKHCKYFADTVKAQGWDHKEDNCFICHRSTVVGKSQIRRADNPNYECIFGEVKNLPLDMLHPHSFPVAGDPGDIYEKAIIVMWQLLTKFQLTQPGVVSNYREEFAKVFTELKLNRLWIWRARKISSQSQILRLGIEPVDIQCTIGNEVCEEVRRIQNMADPFQLWEIILLVNKILRDVVTTRNLKALINPNANMPAEFRSVVSQGVSNSAKYLSTANQVLEALTSQVIPYRDVLTNICGGSLDKKCSFCSEKIIVIDMALGGSFIKGPFVLFGCYLSTAIYSCLRSNCLERANSMRKDWMRSGIAVLTAKRQRWSSQCDFCLKLPPRADVHRCSKCLSVMYCSTACRDQDREVHKKVCKEDVEERKKKFGRSGRREWANDALEKITKVMEEVMEEVDIQEACEVIHKFKLKNSKKSNK